jgi:hypothetical protein
MKFEEADATRITLIPSMTSQGRLTTLLNNELEGNSSRKINTEHNEEPEDLTDLFFGKCTPEKHKENYPKDSKSA